MDRGILLESGTNELEILEFKVGENYYGINVAKIKEILPYAKPTPIPNAHSFVEGIFMPREEIITVVDLAKCLSIPSSENLNNDMYIVTNFNRLHIAFHVHTVIGIHRLSWTDITKPDATINSTSNGIATGIVKLGSKLIVILDFEKIITDINPETGLKISDLDSLGQRNRIDMPILIAEDSPLLSTLLVDCLKKAGYNNLTLASNGLEAWNKLNEFKSENTVKENVTCVITDIEMPQMDGHHLTKLIKEDGQLAHIPVVIFSSLVNDEMRRKGEALGADAQLSKPDIGNLVEIVDKLLGVK